MTGPSGLNPGLLPQPCLLLGLDYSIEFGAPFLNVFSALLAELVLSTISLYFLSLSCLQDVPALRTEFGLLDLQLTSWP